MALALSELVARLQADVPARDAIPSLEQYERCVRDAVADFSRRAGRVKIATLSIVAGTATYSLPADFVRLIRIESLFQPDGVMHTASGLVPVSQSFSERTTIADGQITFWPTPNYSTTRYLHYQAGWVLDASNAYQELGEAEAEIAMRLAAAKALFLQANKAAQEAWQYALGDERVSKERLAGELRAQAEATERAYTQALSGYNGGTFGIRADYPSHAYD